MPPGGQEESQLEQPLEPHTCTRNRIAGRPVSSPDMARLNSCRQGTFVPLVGGADPPERHEAWLGQSTRAARPRWAGQPIGQVPLRPTGQAALRNGWAKPTHLKFAQHLNPKDAAHAQNTSWSPVRVGAGGVGVSAPTASQSSSSWPAAKLSTPRWPEPAGSSWPGCAAPTADRPRPNDWPARGWPRSTPPASGPNCPTSSKCRAG
jgi:hypothetical protein